MSGNAEIYEFHSGRKGLAPGGSDGQPPGMEARVAVLEEMARQTGEKLTDIRLDVRGLRDKQDTDFRLIFGAIIAVALGLAAVMAKGFHWY